MKLRRYHRFWDCSTAIFDCVNTFFIEGSCARVVVRNHGDRFRTSRLFSGSPIFTAVRIVFFFFC